MLMGGFVARLWQQIIVFGLWLACIQSKSKLSGEVCESTSWDESLGQIYDLITLGNMIWSCYIKLSYQIFLIVNYWFCSLSLIHKKQSYSCTQHTVTSIPWAKIFLTTSTSLVLKTLNCTVVHHDGTHLPETSTKKTSDTRSTLISYSSKPVTKTLSALIPLLVFQGRIHRRRFNNNETWVKLPVQSSTWEGVLEILHRLGIWSNYSI